MQEPTGATSNSTVTDQATGRIYAKLRRRFKRQVKAK